MNLKKTIPINLAVVLILTATFFGCTGLRKAAVIMPQPTCAEAVGSGIRNTSDNDLTALLDESQGEDRRDSCWVPLVKLGLDDKRDIPRAHLAKAIKVFNKREHEAYFHKAVYRYFADLSKNRSGFRPEDRRLLQAYSSYLINSVRSQEDPNLKQAKLLCKRLDRNLYAKLFE